MKIPTRTTTTQTVPFKSPQDAIRALQHRSLTAAVRDISSTADYQALLRDLKIRKMPFGIVIVTAKE